MRRAGVAIALIALFLAAESSALGSASDAGNSCKSLRITSFELAASRVSGVVRP